MNFARFVLLASTFTSLLPGNTVADIVVTDDSGSEIRLRQPAERIISLAPNLTELFFAAGAVASLIATVRYSDFPDAAKKIPIIGDAYSIDMESVMQLSPDLIVLWKSGTPEPIRRRLVELGFTLYISEPDTLDKIASSIQRFGLLAGTADTAYDNSRQFSAAVSRLQQQYSFKAQVPVFYQFWNQPVFTINGQHLISRVIELCGGTNIFASLTALTPQLNKEAVLVANPTVIIASGDNSDRPLWLDDWMQWPTVTAVENNHLYSIPPDFIQRHTSRIIEGATLMCEFIDRARNQK